MEIKNYVENDIKNGFDNELWHSGLVAEIKSKSGCYQIKANGMIDCELIAKKDFIDDFGTAIRKGEIILRVKDKNNMNVFYSEMSKYIKNDEHLEKILSGKDEKYSIEFAFNNWLELFHYDENNELVFNDVLDEEFVSDAINGVVETVKNNERTNKYAIYCRTAVVDEDAINMQKYLCMYSLERKYGVTKNDVDIYIDNGFSGEKFYLELERLLNKVKDGTTKIIITLELTRLSRESEKYYEIGKILKDNNADIYIVEDKKFLCKDILSPELMDFYNQITKESEIELRDEIENEYEK